METKEYRTIDKSKWGEGPWLTEPDKMQFPDEATGLPCLIVRVPYSGHLCGYVGVPEGHPYFGKGYNDIDGNIDVHGGLTFAKACAKSPDESRGVCHIPGSGEPDHVWWFGFDCAHCGDYMPMRGSGSLDVAAIRMCGIFEQNDSVFEDETYKDLDYVKGEIRSLAKQLAAAAQV